MFKVFSTVFKLMLVSMFTFYFGHGYLNMYRYRRVHQSRPYTVVSCSLTHLSSLSQCAALADKSKSVTFFFHTDLGPDGYICRWDCFFVNSYSSSMLCNLPCTVFEVIWKKNEALHRSPIASSVYSDNYDLWGPIYATDSLFPASNTDTHFFHSYTEVTPWIRVDLKKIIDISFLRVYIRTDTEGKNFHDTAVEVADNSMTFVQRGFYKGPAMTKEVVEILCESQTIGRFVRLRIIEGFANNLDVLELEIYIL